MSFCTSAEWRSVPIRARQEQEHDTLIVNLYKLLAKSARQKCSSVVAVQNPLRVYGYKNPQFRKQSNITTKPCVGRLLLISFFVARI
jgi:hypothetical protein